MKRGTYQLESSISFAPRVLSISTGRGKACFLQGGMERDGASLVSTNIIYPQGHSTIPRECITNYHP